MTHKHYIHPETAVSAVLSTHCLTGSSLSAEAGLEQEHARVQRRAIRVFTALKRL